MPEQVQKVYAVRHGETEWSLSGRHTGLTYISLTKRGRQRAKLLRPLLTREVFTLVLTSPLKRARRIIARARGEQGNVVLFAHGHLLAFWRRAG